MMLDIDSLINTATHLRSEREYPSSIELFTKCITNCLDCSTTCSKEMLASLYNERGFTKYLYVDFKGAVEDYTKAIEIEKTAVYYYNRGLVRYRLARFREAVNDTSEALKLKPDFPDALRCQRQAVVDGKL